MGILRKRKLTFLRQNYLVQVPGVETHVGFLSVGLVQLPQPTTAFCIGLFKESIMGIMNLSIILFFHYPGMEGIIVFECPLHLTTAFCLNY